MKILLIFIKIIQGKVMYYTICDTCATMSDVEHTFYTIPLVIKSTVFGIHSSLVCILNLL